MRSKTSPCRSSCPQKFATPPVVSTPPVTANRSTSRTLVPDLAQALEETGLKDAIVQQGETAAGARFAYVDTVQHNGTMLELIETSPESLSAFDYMRRCADEWDGSKPIRG